MFESTKLRRKAMISFCDAYKNSADKFVNDTKNTKCDD